ncbi:transposase [Leptolyngbya sp. FACHB-321]|uniref:transposase n=1 Tax=Leptolyngbya sp. FACHB-321 TaxID=2692807 RepID=UPI0018F0324A|nr:transposase [Leptolyngbya sp. FACHB-321]
MDEFAKIPFTFAVGCLRGDAQSCSRHFGFKRAPVGADLADNQPTRTEKSETKPAPTNAALTTNRHGIPEIIRGFKTFSARCINQRRQVTGVAVWQRNYYEHIVRDETSLQRLRQYIHSNPLSWQDDQLHPDCPPK